MQRALTYAMGIETCPICFENQVPTCLFKMHQAGYCHCSHCMYVLWCTLLKSGLLSSHFLVLRLIVQLKSESKCTSVAVPQRKKHQMLACISGRLQRGRLTSESTSSRLLAVTSDQRRPNGKTRKWPGMSGTAAVKWLLMPSLKPREWQSL